MSRVHQGKSEAYQRKIVVREVRKLDRLTFQIAKALHDKKYPDMSKGEIDRAFIRRWKIKIYKHLEYTHGITHKNFEEHSEEEIYEQVMGFYEN